MSASLLACGWSIVQQYPAKRSSVVRDSPLTNGWRTTKTNCNNRLESSYKGASKYTECEIRPSRLIKPAFAPAVLRMVRHIWSMVVLRWSIFTDDLWIVNCKTVKLWVFVDTRYAFLILWQLYFFVFCLKQSSKEMGRFFHSLSLVD